jgi:hypothetical protein
MEDKIHIQVAEPIMILRLLDKSKGFWVVILARVDIEWIPANEIA